MQQPAFLYPDYPPYLCVYCGETADTVDHLFPRGWSGDTTRKLVPVVPACRECNSTLQAIFLPSVEDRRAYIHRRYRVKYRRALQMLYRTEEGLAEFGPNLRLLISKLQDKHDAVMNRLNWPHDPNYDADAWADAWSPVDAETAPPE